MKAKYKLVFLALTLLFVTYQTFGYSTEKILSVTCYYSQGTAYGTKYLGWSAAGFVSGNIYNGPGEFYIEVHITGGGIDRYVTRTVTGFFYFDIGFLSSQNVVHVTVVPYEGNANTYCTVDVWQWKQ